MAEDDKQNSINQTDLILEKANEAYISIDEQSRIINWNPYASKVFGWEKNEVIGKYLYDLIIPERYREAHKAGMSKFFAIGVGAVLHKTIEIGALHRTKGEFPIELNIFPIKKADNTWNFHAFIRDITTRKQAEDRSQKILEATPDATIMINEEGKIIFINKQTEKLFGYDKNELLNQYVEILIPEPYRSRHPKHRKDYFQSPRIRPMGIGLELYGLRKNGKEFPVEISLSPLQMKEGIVALASIRDISERKQAEREIVYLSNHDVLTNLYNRAAFEEALKKEIRTARQNNTNFAILMLDLDNFKNINDTFGHHVGDELLINVAKQLQDSVRRHDFVARLGGDEFVIIFSDIRNETDVDALTKHLIRRFNKPFKLDNHYFHATVSIGVAIFPYSGTDEIALVKNADIALYSVKELGRNNYQFFSDEINEVFKRRSKLETELPLAIEENQFYLVYQPQYKLPEKQIFGMEALIRWQHPEQGIIFPNEFIPIAEKNGFIIQIGDWVLKNACQQYVSWKNQGVISKNLKLAVNLSPKQLSDENFLETFKVILQDTKMPPTSLELELTETAVMTSAIDLDSILEQLRIMGISISIDDFGAGYSSLSRLKNLPVSSLKIDKSFIDDLSKDPDDAMIVKSIIALGNSLGLNVIPEGVETEEQLQLLIQYQCQIVQGFYFGKEPLNAEGMTHFLHQNSRTIAGEIK